MQRRVAPGGSEQASQGLGHAGFRHPGGPLVHGPAVRQLRQHHPPFPGQGFQGPQQGGAGHLQQFLGPLQEHLFRDIDMALPAHGVQEVQQPRGQAGRGQGVQVEAAGQAVGGEKPQAVDIQGQLIGVGGHHFHRPGAVLLIDLGGHAHAHAQALQGHQHLPGRFVGLPVPANLLHLFGPDPRHLRQALRLVADHRQGLGAEMGHQALGQFRADALDEPRGQIFFDAGHRGGEHRVPPHHPELLPPLGMHLVAALEVELFPFLDRRQRTHHRGGLAASPDPEAHHGVVAFRVGEGEALHRPLQGRQRVGGQVRGYGWFGLCQGAAAKSWKLGRLRAAAEALRRLPVRSDREPYCSVQSLMRLGLTRRTRNGG